MNSENPCPGISIITQYLSPYLVIVQIGNTPTHVVHSSLLYDLTHKLACPMQNKGSYAIFSIISFIDPKQK